jgi:hypothetical protein
MPRRDTITWKTWFGAALALWLLVAQAFAVAHEYDTASHANGEDCAICFGAATFGAGNVASPISFEPVIATAFIVVAGHILFLSAVPTRRYARGPPHVSFKS